MTETHNQYYHVKNKKGSFLANVPKPAEPGIWFADEAAAYPFQNIEEAEQQAKSFDAAIIIKTDD